MEVQKIFMCHIENKCSRICIMNTIRSDFFCEQFTEDPYRISMTHDKDRLSWIGIADMLNEGLHPGTNIVIGFAGFTDFLISISSEKCIHDTILSLSSFISIPELSSPRLYESIIFNNINAK